MKKRVRNRGRTTPTGPTPMGAHVVSRNATVSPASTSTDRATYWPHGEPPCDTASKGRSVLTSASLARQ